MSQKIGISIFDFQLSAVSRPILQQHIPNSQILLETEHARFIFLWVRLWLLPTLLIKTSTPKSCRLPLVDFWAPWCGPCRLLSPLIEAAAEEFSGKLKVCKYNCDESTSVAAGLGIRSIPTVVVYKDGKPAATQVGAMNKNELTDWIQSLL